MVEFKYLRILILNSKNLPIYEFKYRPIYEYNLQCTNLTRTYSLEDTFARRLKDVLKTFLQDVLKTVWRCPKDVLKTSWRRLEDVWQRRIYWSWSRRLKNVLSRALKTKTKDVFKKSSGRLHQEECLLGRVYYILNAKYFAKWKVSIKMVWCMRK